MSSIEGRLIDLQERVERHNETRNTRRDLQGSFAEFTVPRQGSSRRPNNLFTKNQLPTFPVQSPHVVETENRMRDIHKISGKLNIGGTEHRSAIEDLQTLGDLGSGTCGQVVKMLHKPSEEIIAVKQMRRSGNSDENKRILMDLDVVVQSNDCPYIVRCYGCFITDTDVWICMELMATCFDKLLKRLRMPVPEAILGKVTVATVNALSYLKDKHKVIHRDVKPSNILLDERGNVKLCDFGISGRLVDSKAKTRTAGCAAYLAPERIEPPDPHRPMYDIRADVWSLGISLVELATGVFPYRNCKHDIELLSRVVNEEPPQLPSDSDFSPDFKSFVSQCLTKNYRDRPKYAKLLKHPFVVKSEQSDVSVGDWFASLPISANNTPAKTASVTTTAVFNVNQPSQVSNGQLHAKIQPTNDYSTSFKTNVNREENNVSGRENFVPSSRENYVPNTREIFAPSSRENYVPNTREIFPPSSRENYVPNIRENYMLSTRENFVPGSRENYVPSTRENYVPSTRESSYVTNFRENNYVTSLRDNHVLSSRENYVPVPPREDRVNFVPGLRDELRVNNYVTSHNGQRYEPRNSVTSTLYWTPDQATPTPQRAWWSGNNVGGSSSQPTSLDTDYDSLSPYPRRKAIEGSSSPPPLPARRVSLDHRLKSSPASSGNTSPIVLQRFHHQNQQRRSRVDLHSTPRHRSLSREHSAGRSPEPPPRISRQRYMLGHNLSSSTDIEPPPLHERLHAPLPLFNRERLAEGRSHSLTRGEVRNGHLTEPLPPPPAKHHPEDQRRFPMNCPPAYDDDTGGQRERERDVTGKHSAGGWLQSLAGLVKRRLSGYVKPAPPTLQRARLAPHQPRCPEGECWSLPGSPRPPRAPRHPH